MVARDCSPPAPRSCCLILHHTADATEKIAGNMHTDLSSELEQIPLDFRHSLRA